MRGVASQLSQKAGNAITILLHLAGSLVLDTPLLVSSLVEVERLNTGLVSSL